MTFKSLITTMACIVMTSGCADRILDKASNKPLSDLENAAQQAQTRETQKSYIKNEAGPGRLTPESLHASPSIDGPSLKGAKISPDGNFATVLQGRKDDARQQDLWAYDLESGQGRLLVSSTELLGEPEKLSLEEKNRREREREYGSGIVTYKWVSDNLLLFPLGGDIYLYDIKSKVAKQVTATKGYETDPKVFGAGRYVGYIRDNNLFVKDLKSGLERQLSDGATDLIRNGIASFVVQEELNRFTGYWPSPDAGRVAYTQTDDNPVAKRNRIEYTTDGVKNITQRYPFAGTPNALVKLGVVAREGGRTKWVDIGAEKDIYLTRVFWSADSQILYAGILSRDQKSHKLLKINPRTGTSDVLFEETSKTWVNAEISQKALKDETLSAGNLLWSSERNGQWQLFNIQTRGEMAGNFTAVTPADILMTKLNCVSEDAGNIFFTGWKETPLERHLYKVKIDGTGFSQISQKPGTHSASFSKNCERYIGGFSDVKTPNQTRTFENDGTPLTWLNENKIDANHAYAPFLNKHIVPEFGILKTNDGTELHYEVFKPHDLKPGEKRPSITLVYGGPHVQKVFNGWSRKSFSTMLAHHGFVVFQMDNRGSGSRGKKFEDAIYRKMGQPEVADQKLGAAWLKSQPFIDPDKMGVYGWSYGGYMTAHMLAQTNDYKAGVIGAPVTEWQLYDTAYTERYLGSPDPKSPNYTEGSYEKSNVFPYLGGLTEPFLLIHGMSDDNVVFRNSTKLMDDMQNRGAHNMSVMAYPREKHGFRGTKNRIHRDRQILDFFLKELRSDYE